MIAYKLVRRRKNGTYGPLFIDRRSEYPIGTWVRAEPHRTKGFAYRPGFHCTLKPEAPHLKQGPDRVWLKVEVRGTEYFDRPPSQGGRWVLAQHLRVIEALDKSTETC